jgi:hypothetical protein
MHLSAMIWDWVRSLFSAVGATVMRNTCFGRTSLVISKNVTDPIASDPLGAIGHDTSLSNEALHVT